MTDTMLFGILKMPFEMAMKDEISRLQYYARVQELVGRFEAQQKAEPVAYFDFQEAKFSWAKHMKIGPVPVSIKVEPMKLFSEPPQQQAEPVACQSCQDIGGNWAWKCNLCGEVDESREPEPPQRPWVGLTDEEMSDTVADMDVDFGDLLWKVVCLTKIIEAELKERNGY